MSMPFTCGEYSPHIVPKDARALRAMLAGTQIVHGMVCSAGLLECLRELAVRRPPEHLQASNLGRTFKLAGCMRSAASCRAQLGWASFSVLGWGLLDVGVCLGSSACLASAEASEACRDN